ncbi:MAG: hypothetical protein R6U41_05475 [Desulfosalsimonas sp.]|uniref:hypothetical protein n=1 Tax=Desulfosalsimonas sp. TaxID=3073848 RepID=UPI003970EC01
MGCIDATKKDLKYESNNHTMRITQKFDFPTAVIIRQEVELLEIISYCPVLNLCFHAISGGAAKLNAIFLLRCHESCARFFFCNAPVLSADRNKKIAQEFSGIRLPRNVFAVPGRVDNGKNPFRAEKQNKCGFGMEIALKGSDIILFFFSFARP